MAATIFPVVLPFLLWLATTPFEQRMQSGMAALGENKLALAQASFEQAARLEPADPRPWFLLTEIYTRRKSPAARTAASKAAVLGAKYAEHDPSQWRALASFCLNTGQFDRAIAAAVKGLARDDSAELHTIVAQAYAARKEYARAAEQFQAALNLAPYEEPAYFRLAQIYLVQQDFPRAIGVLESARRIFDKSPQIELALGVAYYGQRKFPDAVAQFVRVMDLDPDVPQPYQFLARMIDHLTGRLAEIIERARQFEQRDPRNPAGYLLHAKAIIAQLPSSGLPPEGRQALELLEKARSLDQQSPEIYLELGGLLERKGDLAGAAANLEKSIRLHAANASAHFQLARVYDRLGRAADAANQRKLHEKYGESANRPK